MQIKTIKRNIETKLNEWLGTITDSDLVKDLRDNVLVSGGSIVSMMLNEKVNDYDIYINDIDVLVRLCNYYIKDYNNDIRLFDGRRIVELKNEINGWSNLADDDEYSSAFKISVTNLKEDQIKLWFENKLGMFKPSYEKPDELLYKPVFFSPNAISLSNDIQIVIRFHGNNEEIHKTFDYVHATNYFTFKDGLVTNREALESIITKQLKYNGSLYPLTSVIRIKKFLKRGWNINAGEILKILFQVSELDLKDPNVLEEQLIGVDIAFFGTIINILRGVPTEKMTSQYISTIIDKVFNDTSEEG